VIIKLAATDNQPVRVLFMAGYARENKLYFHLFIENGDRACHGRGREVPGAVHSFFYKE